MSSTCLSAFEKRGLATVGFFLLLLCFELGYTHSVPPDSLLESSVLFTVLILCHGTSAPPLACSVLEQAHHAEAELADTGSSLVHANTYLA